MRRPRPRLPRYEALPIVQKDGLLATDHERLTGQGFSLDKYVHVVLDRRRLKARCRIVWRKKSAEPKIRMSVTFTHEWTEDLRKHAR